MREYRTARTAHQCSSCGRDIDPGVRYLAAGRQAICPYPCAHQAMEAQPLSARTTEDQPEDTEEPPEDLETPPEDLEDLDEDAAWRAAYIRLHLGGTHKATAERRADAAWRAAYIRLHLGGTDDQR